MPATAKDGESITNEELERMLTHAQEEDAYLACPDCMSRLTPGPCGGLSQNFLCHGCGARFNCMGPFGAQRLNDRRVEYKEPTLLDKIYERFGFARSGRFCSGAPNPHRKSECSNPKACRNPE